MSISGYILLSSAVALVVIAQQFIDNSNSICKKSVNNTKNSQSERAQNAIESITQQHKENEKNGGFPEAKLVLKNGFINSIYAGSAAENIMMDGIETAEKLLFNQPAAAAAALQKANEDALRSTFDVGVLVFQTLGEASALTNYIAKQGLVETSRKFQLVGEEIQYQLKTSITSLIDDKVSVGDDRAQLAINFAREAILDIFARGYDLIRISHKHASKAIVDAQAHKSPTESEVKNFEASEAAAKDLDAFTAISEINKAAAQSIKGGASANKVNQLKELLINSIGNLVQEASDERDYLAYCHKLADTDPSSAKDLFLKENKETSSKIQEAMANIFLDLAATGLNTECSAKKQIETAIRAVKYGNVEMASGRKTAVTLTILGIGLPENVRSLELRAVVESGRHGKLIIFKKIIEAAKITFKVL